MPTLTSPSRGACRQLSTPCHGQEWDGLCYSPLAVLVPSPGGRLPPQNRMSLFLRPILGGCFPPAPLSSQALSWGSGEVSASWCWEVVRPTCTHSAWGTGAVGAPKREGPATQRAETLQPQQCPSVSHTGWVGGQTDRVRHHREAAPSTVQGCQSRALWSMRGGAGTGTVEPEKDRIAPVCVCMCACACVQVCACSHACVHVCSCMRACS